MTDAPRKRGRPPGPAAAPRPGSQAERICLAFDAADEHGAWRHADLAELAQALRVRPSACAAALNRWRRHWRARFAAAQAEAEALCAAYDSGRCRTLAELARVAGLAEPRAARLLERHRPHWRQSGLLSE